MKKIMLILIGCVLIGVFVGSDEVITNFENMINNCQEITDSKSEDQKAIDAMLDNKIMEVTQMLCEGLNENNSQYRIRFNKIESKNKTTKNYAGGDVNYESIVNLKVRDKNDSKKLDLKVILECKNVNGKLEPYAFEIIQVRKEENRKMSDWVNTNVNIIYFENIENFGKSIWK